jgi:hypothetical protein
MGRRHLIDTFSDWEAHYRSRKGGAVMQLNKGMKFGSDAIDAAGRATKLLPARAAALPTGSCSGRFVEAERVNDFETPVVTRLESDRV